MNFLWYHDTLALQYFMSFQTNQSFVVQLQCYWNLSCSFISNLAPIITTFCTKQNGNVCNCTQQILYLIKTKKKIKF